MTTTQGKSDVSAHTIITRGGKHLLSFTLQYMQFQKYKAMHPRKPEGCLCGQSEAQLANLPSSPIANDYICPQAFGFALLPQAPPH